jgi:hypothetical protein
VAVGDELRELYQSQIATEAEELRDVRRKKELVSSTRPRE